MDKIPMEQTSQSSVKSKQQANLQFPARSKNVAGGSTFTASNLASSSAVAMETPKAAAGFKLPPMNNTHRAMEHSFLTDVADVRQMEQGLLQLLEDFHFGKLQAFGLDCTFEKMDEVRERQERLAKLHFELDGQHDAKVTQTSEGAQAAANKNLSQLMDNLQDLCESIQNLQKDQAGGGHSMQ